MLFLLHEGTVPFQLKLNCYPNPLKHRKILSTQGLPQRKRWRSRGGSLVQLGTIGIETWFQTQGKLGSFVGLGHDERTVAVSSAVRAEQTEGSCDGSVAQGADQTHAG